MEITPTADRRALAKMVTALFEHWHLSAADRAALLGLGPQQRAGVAPLRHDRDTRDRVGHLLAIHASLRQLFPQNRELAYRWMSTQNKAFENRTPVEIVQTWGFAGLLRIRTYLDRAQHS
ncbi:MAG TPA: MbcA/ParS/Xre antitoxin family protein [Casimicrobium sp.]|jgi:uncharacterized protein (DUF2384 family)|nr:MbcA/ParS/Xre antitoxin family protein [Casimicrobium sp.]